MPKRQTETEDGSSTHKKQRRTQDTVLFEKILEQAQAILNLIPNIESDIKQNPSQNTERLLRTVKYWRMACTYAKETAISWTTEDLGMLDELLPADCACAF